GLARLPRRHSPARRRGAARRSIAPLAGRLAAGRRRLCPGLFLAAEGQPLSRPGSTPAEPDGGRSDLGNRGPRRPPARLASPRLGALPGLPGTGMALRLLLDGAQWNGAAD